MAGEDVVATLDIAPEVLADFAAVIGTIGKVVGSAECDTAVRLKLVVPAEFGPRVTALVEKTRGAINYRLVPAL